MAAPRTGIHAPQLYTGGVNPMTWSDRDGGTWKVSSLARQADMGIVADEGAHGMGRITVSGEGDMEAGTAER